MSTSLAFLFFGVIVVAAIFSAAKIQRAELLAAREIERKRKARIEEYRAKCYRPDGD